MKNPSTKKERITIRLTPYQMQCLTDLKNSLNTTYSLLTRSIIGNFLTQYEDNIDRIIENKENEYANNQFEFEGEED
jgi:hypothetical protein